MGKSKGVNSYHQPVLLSEAIEGLNLHADGCYVDATFGRGGHSQQILKNLSAKGKLLVVDQDPQAYAYAQQLFSQDSRVIISHNCFAELTSVFNKHQVIGKLNGILFDIGMSSDQLEDSARGFSFLRDGPLDMRMNNQVGKTAAEWLKHIKVNQLAKILAEYGEERYALRIAKAIVDARDKQPINSSLQLAQIITDAHPRWPKDKHPATKSFQAIRILVNNELEVLSQGLSQALDGLAVGGRLVVISFHSLEDRIVKQFINRHSKDQRYPPGLPIKNSLLQPRLLKIGKAVKPTKEEIINNPRARSAVLRIAEKLR